MVEEPKLWAERHHNLSDSLPSPDRATKGENDEEKAKAILNWLVDRALETQATTYPAIPPNPATCPNCDTPADSTRSPYCGEMCREVAGFVRQLRAGLEEGTIFDHDRQVALGQVLWHLLGGGRPLRQGLAPPRSVESVLKREKGICQGCGETATTVDHIATGCNRPINLRAVCANCCLDRPFGDPALTGRPEFSTMLDALAVRVGSVVPIRCCDDPSSWDWRRFLNERRDSTKH